MTAIKQVYYPPNSFGEVIDASLRVLNAAAKSIALDIVGYKNQLVVCEEKGHGHKAKLKTKLMKEKDALKKLEQGKVTLGMCAWR